MRERLTAAGVQRPRCGITPTRPRSSPTAKINVAVQAFTGQIAALCGLR
jgi:hypothetical protein